MSGLIVTGFILALISAGVALIVGLMPGGWIADAVGYWNQLPTGLMYFLDLMEMTYGFSVIFTAYAAKFLIRRLPVIG